MESNSLNISPQSHVNNDAHGLSHSQSHSHSKKRENENVSKKNKKKVTSDPKNIIKNIKNNITGISKQKV